MNDTIGWTALFLRGRASHYRSLAEKALSAGMARELITMADEYEEDARRLQLSFKARIPKPAKPRRGGR